MEVGLECPEEEDTERDQTQENATGERAIETDVVMGQEVEEVTTEGKGKGRQMMTDDNRENVTRAVRHPPQIIGRENVSS